MAQSSISVRDALFQTPIPTFRDSNFVLPTGSIVYIRAPDHFVTHSFGTVKSIVHKIDSIEPSLSLRSASFTSESPPRMLPLSR
jgi:hypothetical protein